MMRLFNRRVPKCQFFVWYLGSKETEGVRGPSAVLPAMRQLLNDSFIKTPNKATVQVSAKGLKLTQVLPMMSKNGQVKAQRVKFHIEATNITYSMIGSAPFDDVVAVVMLVYNPEMHSPLHVHCYRCDSTETASLLHNTLQKLIERPETQRSIASLEERLFLSGILLPRMANSNVDTCNHLRRRTTFQEIKRKSPNTTAQFSGCNKQERSVNGSEPQRWALSPDQRHVSVEDLPRWSTQKEPQRRFCDGQMRERKSVSVDNLMFSSRPAKINDERNSSIIYKDNDKINKLFGGMDDRNLNFSALWKRSQRSLSLLNNL